MAVLLVAGGLAVGHAPSSIGGTAWPSAGSSVHPGDGPVGKDAPWHVDGLDFFFEGSARIRPPGRHPARSRRPGASATA